MLRSRQLVWAIIIASGTACCHVSAEEQGDALPLVSRYKAVWTAPPLRTPANQSVDGPLMGNGDLLVAIGGGSEALRCYVGKSDLWRMQSGGGAAARPLAKLDLDIPSLAGASYRVEQTLGDATTLGYFEKDGLRLNMRSWVAATEPLFVARLSAEGGKIPVNCALQVGGLSARIANKSGGESACWWVERRIDGNNISVPAAAACALRIFGVQNREFTVEPGQPITLVVAVASRFDAKDYLKQAIETARGATLQSIERFRKDHEAWWRDYWNNAFVEIPDKFLEQRYYLSLYGIGCASRNPSFPPGLFGWVTTDTPRWNGDYHMNYNYVAPFYGLGVSNRIEQLDPCIEPILDAAEPGRALSKSQLGVEGIFIPTGMGPKGSIGQNALMQKSNAAYSCVPIAERWYTTYDPAFARKAYPFVRDVALFWENWLKWEDGRYVIYKDAVHEGSGDNVNPLVSLALVRMVMNLALDMSTELEVDANRHDKWIHIRDHLSEYPTCRLGDMKKWWPKHLPPTEENRQLPVFRYTEKGTEWWRNNTVGIQHIFPAGGIGLDSDPELLQRGRNQVLALSRWIDFNGMNSIYAAAARVGYDPEITLGEMKKMLKKLGGTNGMITGNPHGIEHFSIVPNAIQEMLMQSHEGVIRVFPVWPKDQDARFGGLRARGAFLVSSERKDGQVQYVKLHSERGRACTLVNPWPGKKVAINRNGKAGESLAGERFTFATDKGENLVFKARD